MKTWYFGSIVNVLLENSSDFDASVSNYKYDADGRLYSDSGRGIRGIDYSWADKPQKMYLTTTSGIFQQDNTTMYCNHYADRVRESNDLVTKSGITQTSQYTSFVFDGRGQNGKPGLFSRLLLPWGYVDRNRKVYTYIHDYQGNIRAVVDSAGVAVQTTDYYPYGAPMATSTGANVNHYKYSGKEHETRMGLNQYDFHARNQLPTLGLFDQPDPKAGDYPWLNPYLYCAANPIAYIDPTGEDVWRINTEGELVERIETKEYDMFQFVDSDGNVIQKDGVAQELEFEYGTVLEFKELPYKEFTRGNGEKRDAGVAEIYTVRGDDNATQLFEMMAQNVTGVSKNEISLIRTGYEGDKGRNYISSGKRLGSEPGMSRLYQTQLVDGYNIRSMTHSHPISDYAGKSDIGFKNQVVRNSLLLKVRIPKQFIYCVPKNQYKKF